MKILCRLGALIVLLVALLSSSTSAHPLILCDQLSGRTCTTPGMGVNCVWFAGPQGFCTCQTSRTWSCV